jgi:hypothetical protein
MKQTGIMDTLPQKPPENGFRGGKPVIVEPGNDLSLIRSLAVAGWEGLEPQKLSLSRNTLVSPDGKTVEDIQGKPADVLVEYGCTQAVSRRFRQQERYCHVGIFRFTSPEGACGAYTTMRSGASTVVVRGQGSSEDDNSISFFSGNVFVSLRSGEDDDEAKTVIGKLADQISPYMSDKAPVPKLILSLPRGDRLAGSERFFMGSQSANRFCSVQFLSELLLDQCRGAVSADYLYPRPRPERLKLFVAEYGTKAVAQAAFNSYSANMSSFSRKTIDKNDNQTICKMADSYMMCGLSGLRVWVIAGAKHASAPGMLAVELIN